ncbi:hypothetical protein ACWIFK_20220 [Streptomyces althioticus]
MSEQLAAAGARVAARAASEALKAARSAASPYVMVKHGRREDRAAAYDRFIAACAVLFSRTELDHDDVTELVVSYMAVDLRAPDEVRTAAEVLFRRIVGFRGALGGTSRAGWWTVPDDDLLWSVEPDREEDEEDLDGVSAAGDAARGVAPFSILGPEAITRGFGDSDEVLWALSEFTHIARCDVRACWWHNVVMPWRCSWWPLRKRR